MNFSKKELFSITIWIKLQGLNFNYWSFKGRWKIGSLVGPLVVDKNIKQKKGLNIVKLLVKVQIGKPLPERVHFKNEIGLVLEKWVIYNWKPTICDVCKKYGYGVDVCKKNKTTKNFNNQEKGEVNTGMKSGGK